MKSLHYPHPHFILLIAFMFGFLLTACAPQMPTAQAEAASTATPTATATATATPTVTPTVTLTPTAKATPTPTPITLPVTNGTPIPDLPYEVITAENVSRLRQIARYGYARLLNENPYRLTADGRTIAVGTTAGVEFYDAHTQEKTGALAVDFLRAFDITPDGKYLLTSAGESLTVWTWDGQKVREFDVEAGDAWALNAVALSPDGALLAVQRKKTDWQEADKIDVYRVSDGSLLDTVRGNGVVFSPDGQYLATVFDGSVRLYPMAELGEGWEKRLPKQALPWCGINETCGLTFSPDGTLAAVVRSSRVDVYQVADRKLVRQVSGWEADRYNPPTVQFADGQVLITTPPIYDGQGEVKVKPKAIAVDVASGEWVSQDEVEDSFAYLDNEQVRVFRWKAEGEIGELLDIRNDGTLVLRPKDCDAVYQSQCYSVRKVSGNKWAMLKDSGTLFEFSVPDGYTIGEYSNDVLVFKHIAVISWTRTMRFIQGGFVIFDLDKKQKIFSASPGYVASFTATDDLVSIGYLDSGLHVLLIRGPKIQAVLKYPGFSYHTMDAKGEKLFLFGVDTTKVVDLNTKQSTDVKSDFRAFDIYSWATMSNHFLVNSFAYLHREIRFFDLRDLKLVFSIKTLVRKFVFSHNERLFCTQGDDGFIRVWAVVPEDAPVK